MVENNVDICTYDTIRQYYKVDRRLERVTYKITNAYQKLFEQEQKLSLLTKWQPYYESGSFLAYVAETIVFLNNLLGTNISVSK